MAVPVFSVFMSIIFISFFETHAWHRDSGYCSEVHQSMVAAWQKYMLLISVQSIDQRIYILLSLDGYVDLK